MSTSFMPCYGQRQRDGLPTASRYANISQGTDTGAREVALPHWNHLQGLQRASPGLMADPTLLAHPALGRLGIFRTRSHQQLSCRIHDEHCRVTFLVLLEIDE